MCLASTPARAPDFVVVNATLNAAGGGHAAAAAAATCPTRGMVPPALVAPLAQVAVDAVVKDASLLEGFTADGFVSTLLDRLVTATHCAIAARPLDAAPPLSMAYEVVFGDVQEGWADACAWVARRGTDMVVMMTIPEVPVAVADMGTICPSQWVASQTRVVVGYFAGLVPPKPSQDPGPSAPSGGTGLSAGAIAGVSVVVCVAVAGVLAAGAALRTKGFTGLCGAGGVFDWVGSRVAYSKVGRRDDVVVDSGGAVLGRRASVVNSAAEEDSGEGSAIERVAAVDDGRGSWGGRPIN